MAGMSPRMNAGETGAHRRRYSAFISYRHADNTQEGRRWAEWLHRGLERYVVPPDLVGTSNLRKEAVRDSLYPIFRDEDELPANADLATGIRAALEVSDHLIVLCSPRSAVSPWVRKEVREFKELGRSDRILAIIIAGEPNADDPAKAREGILKDEECFCEELRFGAVREDGTLDWTVRTEPLAADLRPVGTRAEGFVTAEAYREYLTLNSSLTPEKIAARTEAYRQQLDHALIKVAAGLLGVPLGQLIDRDAAHRAELSRKELARAKAEAAKLRKFNRALAMAGLFILTLALLTGWFGWMAALAQRKAEQAATIANEMRISAEARKAEAEQAQAVASNRLRFAANLSAAARGPVLLKQLLMRRIELRVEVRTCNLSYTGRRYFDAEAKAQLAVVEAFLSGKGKWHPSAPSHIASTGAANDYMEIYKFSCCSKVVPRENYDPPPQFSEDGCETIAAFNPDPLKIDGILALELDALVRREIARNKDMKHAERNEYNADWQQIRLLDELLLLITTNAIIRGDRDHDELNDVRTRGLADLQTALDSSLKNPLPKDEKRGDYRNDTWSKEAAEIQARIDEKFKTPIERQ